MTEHEPQRVAWPEERPELTPFLPFVWYAWADGVLSPAELGAFRAHVDAQEPISDEAGESLSRWLEPATPPSPADLDDLRGRIRGADVGGIPEALHSLSDLGLALWKAGGSGVGPWTDPEAVEGLRSLETALGVLGPEAARRALGAPAPRERRARRPARFDAATLRAYLDRDQSEVRERVREALLHPDLMIEEGLGKDEYRERVLTAVRVLADRGLGALAYPEEFGGAADPAGSVAAFETLAFGDLSVLVKFGVQFGLFGGSVHQLGTEAHHRLLLEDIATLRLPGCYAMSETGHGSNVRDLETTATYDWESDELVINTPHEEAGKDWIGNAACHGRMAVVFARLIVHDVDHGVHAVLVPIRDDAGSPLEGVRIRDRGLKEGLNGVDNGRIWFRHVRVPRAYLLDRFASIDDDGVYSSPIPSSGRRFFTMLRTLVAGRVSIAAASVSATKTGLTIATRYADQRRQFGPDGSDEQPLLDYLLVQRSLLPELATAYASHFAIRALQQQFAEAVGGSEDPEVEVTAAALKAYASEHCVRTLQACREACGGQGYMAENRFAALKADTDVFTTFEGANLVLYQLVAKGLLSRYRDEMSDLKLWGALRYLAERAETRLTELNPVVTRRTDSEHLRDGTFHHAAFGYREERLLRSAANRLRSRLAGGMDSFQAINECQDHLVALSRAHAERIMLERLQDAVVHAPTPGMNDALGTLGALYALSRMHAHSGWYLETGYIDPPKARAIRSEVNDLCHEVREHAVLLVDAFGIPEPLLPELVRRSGD